VLVFSKKPLFFKKREEFSFFLKKENSWLILWLGLFSFFFVFSLFKNSPSKSQFSSPKQKLISLKEINLLSQKDDYFLKNFFLKPENSFISQLNFINQPILSNKNNLISLTLFKQSFGKEKENVLHYRVKRGDTLYGIAKKFSISLNNLLNLNNLRKNSLLREGQEIIISSVSGILYQIQEGESLEKIAEKFHLKKEDLLKFNNLTEEEVRAKKVIVIPGKHSLGIKKEKEKKTSLSVIKGYFSLPTTGWIIKKIPKENAVIFNNLCQTPVFSSNEGLVIEKKIGWNKGYGNYLIIRHPNGTKTFYASLGKIYVSLGDYLKKREKIALTGNNTLEKKKCFLYFAIEGAKNPFLD